MKRFAMLLFLASTSLFVSCNSDDDSPIEINQSLIPGEWDLTEVKSENGKVTATIENIPVSGDYSLSGKDYTAKATFTEVSEADKPNTFVSSGGFTLIAKITIPTQSIDYEQAIPDFIGSGEWKVDGTKLITTVANKEVSFDIIALTAQTMSIKKDIKETVEQQGISFEVTGSQIFTLTKK
ncbi:lipocalin-like protein [Aquimarina sp. MAR_2010_214]|uniref:lipocalin family protein n=1 Tax=Aquimarina sp. MAR_2010_214 TaxID=1250026 RepID=UPI000C708F2D|nr:lipocalin family protein [Aquimarina sp. MAR_2010_214]PKV49622.1 lipocalin-like protein [Aquimarina sp. MAR_2010_214]